MTKRTAQAPAPAPAASHPMLQLLEADDEFEEFALDDWGDMEEDQEELAMWDDSWDDDDVEDEFTKQLRAQLQDLSK